MSTEVDTIVALSSGSPPAAVAIVRTSGPQARAAAEQIAGRLPSARKASLRTLRNPDDDEPIDSALLLWFPGPNSATGEDVVEYQCHGGRAVVTALLSVLTAMPGVRVAEPGEFTRRALASGRIDLTEAEGLADLLAAETEGQRRAALALSEGALSRQILEWQSRIVDLHARAEAAIDYVGDEDETGDVTGLRDDIGALSAELSGWLARPRLRPLRDGVRVVFAGPPNAGKSSLLNALVGHERAIVTPVPGTTRDAIEVPIAIDGLPFVLVDTAGLRESADPVEALGVERTATQIARADILVWLGHDISPALHPLVITAESKADLMTHERRKAGGLVLSSVTREGLQALVDRLRDAAATLLPAASGVPLNERQAMLLKELSLLFTHVPNDLLLVAETLRSGRTILDRLTGRGGVEDVLDALFGRFCLGK